MRKNKLKQMFKEGKPIVNGWLQIPSSFSAEVMAQRNQENTQKTQKKIVMLK